MDTTDGQDMSSTQTASVSVAPTVAANGSVAGAGIAAGTRMLLTEGGSRGGRSIVTVARVTRTQILFAATHPGNGEPYVRRFRRDRFMEEVGRTGYWKPRVEVLTPDLLASFREEQRRARAYAACRNVEYQRLTTEQLERIAAIIHEEPATSTPVSPKVGETPPPRDASADSSPTTSPEHRA